MLKNYQQQKEYLTEMHGNSFFEAENSEYKLLILFSNPLHIFNGNKNKNVFIFKFDKDGERIDTQFYKNYSIEEYMDMIIKDEAE